MLYEEPTRVLVLAANPRGTASIRLDQEVREIQDSLERARILFTVRQHWATRPSDLSREILKFRPQLVHFCGHGLKEGIILEDESGAPKLVPPSALASLFKLFTDQVKCVVLNCCYSRLQAQAISEHIPFVIGTNNQISDHAALAFSSAFYEAIGEGKAVDFAFRYGLSRIRLEGIPEDWIPQIFSEQSPIGAELTEISWSDFDCLALKSIQALYRGTSLKFSQARLSQNESLEGEAQYIFSIKLKEDEKSIFRIWLAMKRKKQHDIDRADLALDLIEPLRLGVNKVMLVTNGRFSKGIHSWLGDLAARTGLQHQLLDGPTLLDYAKAFLSPPYASREIDQEPANVQANDHTGIPETPDLSLTSWYSLSPYDRRPESFRQVSITARPDRPIYLIVEAKFSDHFQASKVSFDIEATKEQNSLVSPWPPASEASLKVASAGEQLRQTFVIWPRSAADAMLSNLVRVTAEEPLVIEKITLNSVKIPHPVLSNISLQSQAHIQSGIFRKIYRWQSRGEFFSTLIVAPPGLGKSRIVAEVRQHCWSVGVHEVFMDCESVTTDLDFVRSLLRSLLPFPPAFLDAALIGPLTQWCIENGIGHETSARVARDLCGECGEEVGIRTGDRVDIAAAILEAISQRQPLALIVEDLHKAAPSLLALLSDLTSRLSSSGEAKVLLVASSRPYSGTSSLRREWLSALSSLSLADRCIVLELEPPSAKEARKLLQASILSLEDHQADMVIEGVGTSPFSLREAVLFLLTNKSLVFSELDKREVIAVADPAGLRLALASEELSHATEQRLKLLLENQPDWLRLLLLAGATYGRRFPLQIVLEALRLKDDLQLAYALDTCSTWSIVSFSAETGGWLEFDHDLVREATLLIGPSRSRKMTAKAVLETLGPSAQPQIQCKLAYQAELPEICLDAAMSAKGQARREGRVADIIELNQIAIQVLDPEVATEVLAELLKTGDQNLLDPALRNLDACIATSLSPHERSTSVLQLLMENIEFLCTVGSGSSGAVEAAITEARLIAKRHNDYYSLAQLLYYEGRMWFERNAISRAINLHAQAEALFAKQGCRRDPARAENLVRQAICLRKGDRIDESIAYLSKAARQRPPSDWLLLNKVRSNLGAAYLRSDWSKVRFHWERQIRQASRRGLPSRRIHGLASLSFIDIFEGRVEEGLIKAKEGLEVAERLRLDNQIIRFCLNLASYSLIVDHAAEARLYLLKAEQLALKHGVGRRLWRVIANLATAYEVLGSMEHAFGRDLQAVHQLEGSFSDLTPDGREILPVVNIILRKQIEARFGELIEGIPEAWVTIAKEYASIALANEKEKLPSLLGNFCIGLSVGPRFLLIE